MWNMKTKNVIIGPVQLVMPPAVIAAMTKMYHRQPLEELEVATNQGRK